MPLKELNLYDPLTVSCKCLMEGGGREIEHEEPNSGPLFTTLWEAGKQPSVECPREECKATSVKMRHPGRRY